MLTMGMPALTLRRRRWSRRLVPSPSLPQTGAPLAESAVPFDRAYELDDRYARQAGRVYLSGVQALVRLPLMQRQRDRAAGLDTAGFISGYRGSPLGTYDLALWQTKKFLAERDIRFEPGLNEDLAATAMLGSQQVEGDPDSHVDGVFGIWYGKGPGVDRAGDALKHGNAYGSSPNGGVLVVGAGDLGRKVVDRLQLHKEYGFLVVGFLDESL